MLPGFRSYNIFHFPQSNDQYPWAPPQPSVTEPEPKRERSGCQIHPFHPVTRAIRLPTFAAVYAPYEKTVSLNEFNEYMLQAIRMTIKVYTRSGLILATSLEHILTVHFFGPQIQGMLRRPTTTEAWNQREWATIPTATRIQHVKELVSSHPELFKIIYRNNPLCVIGLQQMGNTDNIPLELMTLSQRMFSKAKLSNSISKAEMILKVALHSWDILRIREFIAPGSWHKSVDIANAVMKRMGNKGVQMNKSVGYLPLLERYREVFQVNVTFIAATIISIDHGQVRRISKNDLIRLHPVGWCDKHFRILFQELYDSCDGYFGNRAILPGQTTQSLYISNVPDTMNAETFADYFKEYHPTSTRLNIQHNKRYGFVNFNTVEEAIAVKSSLEAETIWANRIQYARQHGATR